MGVFRWLGKRAVTETAYVAGTHGIQRWWEVIRLSWLHTKRRCPACGQGVMFPFVESVDGDPKKFVGCSSCDHFEAADLRDTADPMVADSLARLRAIAAKRLAAFTPDELEQRERRLRVNSRCFFSFSFLFLLAGTVFLFLDFKPMTVLNMAAVAGLFFSMGVRHSYRHWQFVERRFFEPGSFSRWFREGKWVI